MRMVEENEVAAARAELGLNQSEMAVALGVNQSTVWRWENGTPLSALAKRAINGLLEEKRRYSGVVNAPATSHEKVA